MLAYHAKSHVVARCSHGTVAARCQRCDSPDLPVILADCPAFCPEYTAPLEPQPLKPHPTHPGWAIKLTWDQVNEIRVWLSKGASRRQLADRYGVSKQAIKCIERGTTWREGKPGPSSQHDLFKRGNHHAA